MQTDASNTLRATLATSRARARSGWVTMSALFLAAILSIFSTLHVSLTTPVIDLFHEGEYLSPYLYLEAHHKPILIHGTLNYIPAFLAKSISVDPHLVTYTRFFNVVSSTFAVFAFFILMDCAAGSRSGIRYFAFLLALCTVIRGNFWTDSALGIQQGAPGARDLTIFLQITIVYRLISDPSEGLKSKIFSFFLMSALSLLTVFGFFWAYNRGIIGATIFFSTILWILFYQRWSALALHGAITSIIFFILQLYIWPDITGQHIYNIFYWIKYNSIWSKSQSFPDMARNVAPVFISVIFISSLFVFNAFNDWARNQKGFAFFGAMIIIFNSLTFKAAMVRADWSHMVFVIPGLCVGTVFAASRFQEIFPTRIGRAIRKFSPRYTLTFSLLLCFVILGLTVARWDRMSRAVTGLVSRLPNFIENAKIALGYPPNIEFFGADEVAVAAALKSSGTPCTLMLDNSGALYFLSQIRPCSQFMYPMYVSQDHQDVFISEIQSSAPAMIVITSSNVWRQLDDVQLEVRSPEISKFIDSEFPNRTQIGKYVLGRPN